MTVEKHLLHRDEARRRCGVSPRAASMRIARLAASLALLGLLAACGNPPEDPGAKRQPEQKKALRDRGAHALADR